MAHYEEYCKIIGFRKANPLPEDQYGEKHHIVPKSICPLFDKSKSKENIVRLSAREHLLAHYHIWKAFRDEFREKTWARKMYCAYIMIARKQLSEVKSESQKGRRNPEAVIAVNAVGANEVKRRNKIAKAHAGSRWFTNGKQEVCAKSCPEGFVPGRLKRAI